jgi:ferric-dicitrate binding protein FerR (iron transport regulator)
VNPECKDDRIWRLFDGDLTPEEFELLERSLEASPEARAHFLDHVDLHNLLDKKFSTPASVARSMKGVVSVDLLINRQRLKLVKYSIFAAAAALILFGVVLKITFVRQSDPLVTFRTSEDTVLSVSHTSSGKEEPAPGTLEKGSRLSLQQGAVELTLASGVTARVEAPADLTLEAEDRILQRLGRVRFHVPKKASGFQVQTPQLLIKDLGTEFGVLAGPGSPDEVHLFKGEVVVTNRHGLRKTETLSARMARVAGPAGHLGPTPVRPEEFPEALLPRIPHLRFSFDSLNGETIPVDGDHPDVPALSAWWRPGRTDPGESPLVPGKFGKAFRFNGIGDHIKTNWPGISGRSARSLAVWLRLPGDKPDLQRKRILVWGDTGEFGGKFEVSCNYHPDFGQVGALRITCGPGYVVGTKDLRDGLWHHLAVVFGCEPDPHTGMPVRLYVDGVVEKASKWRFFAPHHAPVWDANAPMNIGLFLDASGTPRGTLQGELDELHIFSGILTEEGVNRLMNHNSTGAPRADR